MLRGGLNPVPPDLEFEVLAARLHTPPRKPDDAEQKVMVIRGTFRFVTKRLHRVKRK